MSFGGTVGLAVCFALPSVVVFGQTEQHEPIKTTLCNILKRPDRFDGKVVQFRARADYIFTVVILESDGCSQGLRVSVGDEAVPRKGEYAWIPASSDLRHPEPLNWKAWIPPRAVKVVDDDALHSFLEHVSAMFNSGETRCYTCPLFKVSATFVGRFDYRKTWNVAWRSDSSSPAQVEGTASIGNLVPSRLVLASVKDVAAKPIDRSVHGKKK
jgi:hypothetical protein